MFSLVFNHLNIVFSLPYTEPFTVHHFAPLCFYISPDVSLFFVLTEKHRVTKYFCFTHLIFCTFTERRSIALHLDSFSLSCCGMDCLFGQKHLPNEHKYAQLKFKLHSANISHWEFVPGISWREVNFVRMDTASVLFISVIVWLTLYLMLSELCR